MPGQFREHQIRAHRLLAGGEEIEELLPDIVDEQRAMSFPQCLGAAGAEIRESGELLARERAGVCGHQDFDLSPDGNVRRAFADSFVGCRFRFSALRLSAPFRAARGE